jgi:hypothetical protein
VVQSDTALTKFQAASSLCWKLNSFSVYSYSCTYN